MFRKTIKNAAIIFAVAVSLVSCQKDDEKIQEPQSVRMFGAEGILTNDGTKLSIKLKKNPTTGLKGLIADETGNGLCIEEQTITDLQSVTNSYRVIKVVRPDGRYFWIMIDNFKYLPTPSTGSYVYENNPSNVATYGRLYKWTTAYNNRTKIRMKLPKYVNGNVVLGGNGLPVLYSVGGKLPSIADIKDMLESTTMPAHSQSGITVWGGDNAVHQYYDAFLAGREDKYYDETAAYPTLAGYRDNMEAPGVPANHLEFGLKNIYGTYWLSDTEPGFTTAHYPLTITDNSNGMEWNAYVNAMCDDGFGHSVRYIFEPIGM